MSFKLDCKEGYNLDFDEKVNNKVFTFNDLRGVEYGIPSHTVFDKSDKELFMYNRSQDTELNQFLEKIEKEYSNFNYDVKAVENNSRVIVSLIRNVSDFYGGILEDDMVDQFESRSESKIASIMSERGSSVVLMGELKRLGVCRHRSVVFKVICDILKIPCRLISGYAAKKEVDEDVSTRLHCWNEVMIGTTDTSKPLIRAVDCNSFHDFLSSEIAPLLQNRSNSFKLIGKGKLEAFHLYNQGRFEECISVCLESLQILRTKQIRFLSSSSRIHKVIADAKRSLGLYDEALKYYKQCLKELREMSKSGEHPKIDIWIGDCLVQIGLLFIKQNRIDSAEKYLVKGIKIMKKNVLFENHEEVGIAYSYLGQLYGIKGEYEKCLEYRLKGLHLRRKQLGDIIHPQFGIIHMNVATSYRFLKKYEKAIQHLKISEKILYRLENEEDYATFIRGLLEKLYFNYGEIYRSWEKFELARNSYKKVLYYNPQNRNALYALNLTLLWKENSNSVGSSVVEENVKIDGEETQEEKGVLKCAFCDLKKKKMGVCRGCKLVYYCSLEHQKKHWKIHKKKCKKSNK